MPRHSKQRGDKHSPYGAAAQRRKSALRRPAVSGRAAPRFVNATDIDEFMAGYSDEDDAPYGAGMLTIGGVAIRCNADGGIRHIIRQGKLRGVASGKNQSDVSANERQLDTPGSRHGATIGTATGDETSTDSSSDSEVSEALAAEIAVQMTEHCGCGEDYEGLMDAMQRFGANEIGAGPFPEDVLTNGLEGGGSSICSGYSSSGSSDNINRRAQRPATRHAEVSFGPDSPDSGNRGWSRAGTPGTQRKGAAGKIPSGEVRQLKKARKAALRAARAHDRGFDLGAVNNLLHDFVRDDGDILGLPMKVGQSEVLAVHRLASLYGLKCTAQGGGNKRTVMVVSTQRTVMADSGEVAAMLHNRKRTVIRGVRSSKLPPGTLPGGPVQQPRTRGAALRGSGRGGSQAAAMPPPLAAYLQPVAFVSSGVSTPQNDADAVDWNRHFRPHASPARPEAPHQTPDSLPPAPALATINRPRASLSGEEAECDERSAAVDAAVPSTLDHCTASALTPPPTLTPAAVSGTHQPHAPGTPRFGTTEMLCNGGGSSRDLHPPPSMAAGVSDGLGLPPEQALHDIESRSWFGGQTAIALQRPFTAGLGFGALPQWDALSGEEPCTPGLGHWGASSGGSAVCNSTVFCAAAVPSVVGLSGTAADAAAAARGVDDAAVDAAEAGVAAALASQSSAPETMTWQPFQHDGCSRLQQQVQEQAMGTQQQAQQQQQQREPGIEQLRFGDCDAMAGDVQLLPAVDEIPSPDQSQQPSTLVQAGIQADLKCSAVRKQLQRGQSPVSRTAVAMPEVSRLLPDAALPTPSSSRLEATSNNSDDDLMAAVMSAASLAQGTSGQSPAPDDEVRTVLHAAGGDYHDGGGAAAGRTTGLNTPNQTKKQATQVRKKEAKLKRRAERGALLHPTSIGSGLSGVIVLEAAVGFDTATAADLGRSNVGAKYGSFEQHTTGFGSRMMAKMGFAGMGSGLGRGEQGIAEPITALPRPKKLGLGA